VSGDEEAHWTEVFASHPVSSRITVGSVADALKGFSLKPVRDLHWLARAIQPAVYLAATQRRPTMQKKELRDDFQDLSAKARQLGNRLFLLNDQAEDAIWAQAFSLPGATTETANVVLADMDDIADRLLATALILDRIASDDQFWKRHSQKTEQSYKHNLHKWFAVWLSPAFEQGFGKRPGLMNEHRTGATPHGPWADFYQRITGLAFGKPAIDGLRKVLGEARTITKQASSLAMYKFPPGMFPK
jgi:hypothetical protein